MIFVDRHKVPVPEDLIKEGGTAQKERAAAIAYFQAIKRGEKPVVPAKKKKNGEPAPPKNTFEFKAYNSKEVKKALKDLFNGKCAYCESKILVVTVGDIEHFRPKAEILDEENKKIVPGYYWLAYDWDNLLLSCNNCNRKSTQEVTDEEEEAMGKGNQFPILKGGVRCLEEDKNVDEIEKESRLLINPCIDDPEEHLTFLENGAIQAKLLGNGIPSQKGETSINVYGLYRKLLADERHELFKAIQWDIVGIKEIFDDMADAKVKNDAAKVEELDKRLQRNVAKLKDYQDEKKVYSSLARQIIEPFLQENNLI